MQVLCAWRLRLEVNRDQLGIKDSSDFLRKVMIEMVSADNKILDIGREKIIHAFA